MGSKENVASAFRGFSVQQEVACFRLLCPLRFPQRILINATDEAKCLKPRTEFRCVTSCTQSSVLGDPGVLGIREDGSVQHWFLERVTCCTQVLVMGTASLRL